MGCCYSRVEREETVSRCKSRRRYMKQLVKARHAVSASHTMYLRSLRSTGAALLHLANAESHHHLTNHHPPRVHHLSPPPPPPPPMSPAATATTDTWTTSITASLLPPPPPPMSPAATTTTDTWTTSITASPLHPPPPPPPPPASSPWDFWDPFTAATSRSATEDDWADEDFGGGGGNNANAPVNVASGGHAPPSPPHSVAGSSELAVVVRGNSTKDVVEIMKELDEYLLKAAEAGSQLSLLLEVPSSGFSSASHHTTKGGKVYSYGWGLSPSSWTWGSSGSSPKMSGFGKTCGGDVGKVVNGTSHCSTVERLYAWEKKLFEEVKTAETVKIEHEKKVATLKKLEMKRADYMKTEKAKKEVEKLESEMMVASQAIETTSAEIIKLRETELYPQLLELVKGLMCMWRSMYECHQVQKHIVQQLKYLNVIPSTEPTSEIHRQTTLQLELEVQQWHLSFCNMVKAQQDYIQSLTGWLRLSLFQFNRNPLARTSQESKIYSLCEEWHLAVDRIPDKVASEGIKSFLTVIHAIVVQQAEEQKQKKKSESVFKDLEKKMLELRSLESKYGPYSMSESSGITGRNPVAEKRAKVEMLKAKAEEEKTKHEKSVSVTRAMTLNNLQMGLPHVFEGMVGFSSVCMHAFESVYNHTKSADQEADVKRLMT
ncbi:hypothetical protein L484_026653 [Morus notabilis]|uniref:DUF632 domain-containing protein n=1 Tax=Morus notabilis TaxID=981085 RepID=W9SCW1_9ROSA|nr:nitrate regulatory gene2 protein [Morus notabilis]EXC35329.1 hypothetical protein L484_026653 [Morus notabilis]